jgi:hypothetical protein
VPCMVCDRGAGNRQKTRNQAPDQQLPSFHDDTSAMPIMYF